VGHDPGNAQLQQRGPFAAACPLDGDRRRVVDSVAVGAVQRRARHAVPRSACRDRRGCLQFGRDADGEPIVLADEHDGQPVNSGEVHRLVRSTLRGCAVAEPAQGHRVVAEDRGRVRRSGRVGEVRTHLARYRPEAELPRREVGGQLPPAGVRIGSPPERT
jgi:hypothetical protein